MSFAIRPTHCKCCRKILGPFEGKYCFECEKNMKDIDKESERMRLIDADLLIEEYKTSAENTFNRPIKFKNSLIYKQIKKAPTVTILEDIKAEIEEQRDIYRHYNVDDNNIDYGVRSGLSIALNIINKHIGGINNDNT